MTLGWVYLIQPMLVKVESPWLLAPSMLIRLGDGKPIISFYHHMFKKNCLVPVSSPYYVVVPTWAVLKTCCSSSSWVATMPTTAQDCILKNENIIDNQSTIGPLYPRSSVSETHQYSSIIPKALNIVNILACLVEHLNMYNPLKKKNNTITHYTGWFVGIRPL